MSARDQENDPTMEALRDALGYTAESDPDTVEMIMTGYDIAGLEVVTAELTFDSALAGTGVPVRTGDAGPRMLTAEGGGVTFEFEIQTEPPRLSGRLAPVGEGEVWLDQLGNQQSQALDETGYYEFDLVPGSPFRLRYVSEDGNAVATEWVG